MSGGILRVEAQVCTLAMHTAAQYEERGGSVTVSVGEGARQPGLTLSLAPRWGAAQGADMLWQDQVYRPLGMGPETDDGAVDGLRLPKRLLVAPFATYGSGYGGRRMAGRREPGRDRHRRGDARACRVLRRALHGGDGPGGPPGDAVRDRAVRSAAGGDAKRVVGGRSDSSR